MNQNGERQLLVFGGEENYRLPLKLLEQVIAHAKEVVAHAGEEDGEVP